MAEPVSFKYLMKVWISVKDSLNLTEYALSQPHSQTFLYNYVLERDTNLLTTLLMDL